MTMINTAKKIALSWQLRKYVYPALPGAAYIEWDTSMAEAGHVLLKLETVGETPVAFLLSPTMWGVLYPHLRAWVQGLAWRFPFIPAVNVRYGMLPYGGSIYVPGNAGKETK